MVVKFFKNTYGCSILILWQSQEPITLLKMNISICIFQISLIQYPGDSKARFIEKLSVAARKILSSYLYKKYNEKQDLKV